MVEAYQSTFVSAEQSQRWTKEERNESRAALKDLLFVPITFWFTYILLFVGSQPLTYRYLFVNLVNPIVLGIVASLGSTVLKQPAVGVPLMVAAVLVCCAAIGFWFRSADDSKNGVETMTVMPIISPPNISMQVSPPPQQGSNTKQY